MKKCGLGALEAIEKTALTFDKLSDCENKGG